MKNFTPANVQQWVATMATIGATIGAAVTGSYTFMLKTGMIGGKLEKVNSILAEQHIGEEPEQKVVVLDIPNDRQSVYIYENGDTLYYRKYEDNNGKRQKLKRWTSKRSIDDIIFAGLYPSFSLSSSAYASEWYAFVDDDEKFVGYTADGLQVFYIISEETCEFHDPKTGEIVKTEDPPCEQYVVEQKKG